LKILSIIGARPQFIKAAAVSRVIRECHTEVLIHTGQHYDTNMSAVFFEELGIPEPQYNLGISSGLHGNQTGAMLGRIEEVTLVERPDWVLVYGDTNSTLAGALAAAKLHIPVAHVEAGLRSFNRRMPEEVNRVMADHLSDLLFCPSRVAVENLASEGIRRGVHVVGDVMADALSRAALLAETSSNVLSRFRLRAKGFLLVTVHRAENTDDPRKIGAILDALDAVGEEVIFPAHPRTRKAIEALGNRLAPHVHMVEPVGYLDMVMLEKSARMILTDSVGVQKEAYWLGVPCVTLRDETEWVETVQAGWNALSGADTRRILELVGSFVPPPERPPLYGGEGAAVRCVRLMEENHRKSGSEPEESPGCDQPPHL
jgi:UDP-N-acetylglucosamine 2-epimerase